MLRRLAGVSVIVVAVAMVLSQTAMAAISRNTIHPEGTLKHNDRIAFISGPIECTKGDFLRIDLIVTQASTGARAVGQTQARCTGELQEWSVMVAARGFATLEEGHTNVCAFAFTRDRRFITGFREWCAANGVTLSYEE